MATAKKAATKTKASQKRATTAAATRAATAPTWVKKARRNAGGARKLPGALASAIAKELGPLAKRFQTPGALSISADDWRGSLTVSLGGGDAHDFVRVMDVLEAHEVPIARLSLWTRPETGAAGADKTSEVVAALGARSVGLLERLVVVGTRVTLSPAAIGSCIARMPKLRVLEIRGAKLGADLGQLLATLPPLQRLVLHATDIGDAGAVALAGTETLAALEELELAFNRLGEGGVRAA